MTTLGRIIRMRCQDNTNSNLPYRESKLTLILKEPLSGNGKTIMIVTVC